MNTLKVWAHRGASFYAPENTMESFEKAIEQKANGIELDVQLTKDGKVVVVHDEKIDRISNGRGWVKDFYFEELAALNFNNYMPEYGTCRIPLLEDVLKLCKRENKELNIELKTGLIGYKGLEEKVDQLLRQYGMSGQTIVSSFNHYSVMKMKRLNEKVKTGFLFCDILYDIENYVQSKAVDALHLPVEIYKQHLTEGACDFAGNKIEINIWNMTEKEIPLCIKNQVNAVIVDYPDKIINLLES